MSFLGIKDVTISHRKYTAQIRKKEYNSKISKEHTFLIIRTLIIVILSGLKKNTGIFTNNNHDPDNKGIAAVVTHLSKYLF